jgi:hypothetical protein
MLANLRDEMQQVEASGDRVAMRHIIDRLIVEVRVRDGRTTEPRFEATMRFKTAPVSLKSGSLSTSRQQSYSNDESPPITLVRLIQPAA